MVHGADFAAAEVVRIAAAETTRGRIWNPPLRCRGRRPRRPAALRQREGPAGGCRHPPLHVGVDARHRPGSLAAAAMLCGRAMLAPTPSFIGRLFCCAAICTKQVRLYLYKITTKFARASGKIAKYASKTAACAKNTPIVPQSATIGSTQKHGPAFDRCYTV